MPRPRRYNDTYRKAQAFNLDTRVLRKMREWRDEGMPIVRAADIADTLGWPRHQINNAMKSLEGAGNVRCVREGGNGMSSEWECR